MKQVGDVEIMCDSASRKKIIPYCVRNLAERRRLQFFLSEQYEIIGYSDSHYPEDIVDGMKMYALDELQYVDFDYIVPLYFDDAGADRATYNLMSHGIPRKKIVIPYLLWPGNEHGSLDLVDDIKNYYRKDDNLLFGLSYSLLGILKRELKVPFYDCSWLGLDLYYNSKLYAYMKNAGLFSQVQRILFVIPYNYFNYDMSMSDSAIKGGRFLSVFQLDDMHNIKKMPNAVEYMENTKMFGKQILRFYHRKKCDNYNNRICKAEKETKSLSSSVWRHCHPDTIAENTQLFRHFISELSQNHSRLDIIVPPLLLDALNIKSRVEILEMKEMFYDIVMNAISPYSDMRLFDYIDIFHNRNDYFSDVIHLNYYGAKNFTDLINREIL